MILPNPPNLFSICIDGLKDVPPRPPKNTFSTRLSLTIAFIVVAVVVAVILNGVINPPLLLVAIGSWLRFLTILLDNIKLSKMLVALKPVVALNVGFPFLLTF